MSYLDYARTTWAQLYYRMQGYQRKADHSWQQTRLLAYIQYSAHAPEKERQTIYEFLPLSSDPSPKEIARMEKAQAKKAAQQKERDALKLINDYKKKGYL